MQHDLLAKLGGARGSHAYSIMLYTWFAKYSALEISVGHWPVIFSVWPSNIITYWTRMTGEIFYEKNAYTSRFLFPTISCVYLGENQISHLPKQYTTGIVPKTYARNSNFFAIKTLWLRYALFCQWMSQYSCVNCASDHIFLAKKLGIFFTIIIKYT